MVKLRSARDDDVAGIARVHVASWRRAYAGLMPSDLLESLDPKQRSQEWRNELERGRGHAIVAVQNGVIVGFSYISASRDEDAGERTGEVQAIYIDPSFWRQGIGRSLLEESLSKLQGYDFERVLLWVLEGNGSACRFYEAMGFIADGASKAHPSTGLVQVRYARKLS